MMIEAGNVVEVLAGHDAHALYVVLSTENGYVALANGKERLLEKPKRKNVKHIRKTNHMLELSGMDTNRRLRNALAAFAHSEGGTAFV